MRAVCDTHVLLFSAMEPERLSSDAARVLAVGAEVGHLVCADISLWEIAMLHSRGRLQVPPEVGLAELVSDILASLQMQILPITPRIAALSQEPLFSHGDPADRLIAATAIATGLPLISMDSRLREVPGLRCIW